MTAHDFLQLDVNATRDCLQLDVNVYCDGALLFALDVNATRDCLQLDVNVARDCFQLDVNAYSDGALLGEWVPYVQAARDDLERNVEASVRDGQVFYRTTRSIAANQSLLVWYSPAFASALGVPPLRPEYLKGR